MTETTIRNAYRLLDARDFVGADAALSGVPVVERDGPYFEALASLRVVEQRFYEAEAALRNAQASGYDSPRVQTLLDRCRQHKGTYVPWPSRTPPTPAETMLRAQTAFDAGRYEEARGLARRILDEMPDYAGATCLILASEMEEGSEPARRAIERLWEESREPDAVSMLLYVADRRGDYGVVERYAAGVLALPKPSVGLLARVANMRLHGGDPEGAVAAIEAADPGLQRHSRIEVVLGDVWRARGDLERALPHYRRAFDAEPSGKKETQRLGRTLFKLRRWGELFDMVRKSARASFRTV